MQNPYGNGPVVPENPNAPMMEPEKHSAGIGERLVSGVVQGLKSSVGTALIAGAGGAVLGAAGGIALDSLMPSGDEINAALEHATQTMDGVDPASIAQPSEIVAQMSQAFQDRMATMPAETQEAFVEQMGEFAEARDSVTGPLVGGMAAAGGAAGVVTGATGGAMYGAAKGMLWTDRIKQEREAIAQAKATGQIEGGIG